MYTYDMQTFHEFLLEKLQDYEKEKGKRVPLNEFADYLDVSRPVLSYWLGGKTKPSLDNIRTLADKLGPEVYDVLELPRPDPDLTYIQQTWEKLPHEMRDAWVEEAERYFAANIALRELENDKEPPPKRPTPDDDGDTLAFPEPATTRRDSEKD